MSTLNISARQFKTLVAPVLPHVGRDGMVPVLCSVRIETRGKWLVAMATDRFRMGMHRMERPEDSGSGDWAATIPSSAVKGILSTFAPRRGMDADLTLTVANDGHNLKVAAAGAMVGGFFDAALTWPLELGEYPRVDSLIRRTLKDEAAPSTKVRMEFLGDFRAADPHGLGLWVKATGSTEGKPILVTDGYNFIGLAMPRRGGLSFPQLNDWDDVLPDVKAEPPASEPTQAADEPMGVAS